MPRLRSLSAPLFMVVLSCCIVGADLTCAQSAKPPEKESDIIRGTVLNGLTHQPIGRALVYSQDNRFGTLTDSSGHFECKIPPPRVQNKNEGTGSFETSIGRFPPEDSNRPYFLMARKPGFIIDENNPISLLVPGQKEVTIYLVPGARIVGHVSLGGTEISERIQVEIYRRQVRQGVARWIRADNFTTWANGEFRFAELPPGAYKLFTRELMDLDPLTFDPRGQLYGYPPVYFPNAINFASGSVIQLSAGMTFDATLSPIRHEYYPVEAGIANLPEGAPVNVEVSVAGQGGPGYSLGYYPQLQKIRGLLPDGMYTLELSSSGTPGESGSMDIVVKGGAVSEGTVTMVPNAPINVTVTENFTSADQSEVDLPPGPAGQSQRRPRDYLDVNLEPADEFGRGGGASLRPPTGPEDGSLAIDNIWPGRYWVNVQSGRGYVASIKSGETDLLRHPLVVPPGGSADPIEVTMRDDGAQIEGTIEGAPLNPVSPSLGFTRVGNLVYLIPQPESSGQYKKVNVSPDGTFYAHQIPPGDYRVLASGQPQLEVEYRNEETMRQYHSEEQVIRLVAGQKQELRLHVVAGGD